MKKRGIITAAIVLLLTISTLAILATQNPPTIFPNFPLNQVHANTKSYIGSGDQLKALIYITNNHNSTGNATDVEKNIYVPCPSGWEIIWVNLTLSNINAPNVTVIPNNDDANASLDLGFYAMSFRLSNDAYLDSVSVQLYTESGGTKTNLYVYNAIDSGGRPKPQNQISNKTGVAISRGTNWNDVDFSHVFLNTSNTYDNTFFIAAEKDSKTQSWQAVNYTPSSFSGYGYVYKYESGDWSYVDYYDCKLKVNVSASTTPNPESAKPTEIGLTINVSQVSDISKGNGEWINNTVTSSTNGYVFYDVNSTWMATVSFSYIWNITICNNTYTSAATNFDVSHNSKAYWNITVDATNAFPQTNGVNHINITDIPADWGNTSSKAYNQTGNKWITLDSYPPATISFTASNGTWIVNCTAPNYVSSIGFEIGGAPVENATLYEELNITVTFDASVIGNVTLEVFDPFQTLVYTESKSVISAANAWFIWDISHNATYSGNYNVTMGLEGGLEAGYNSTLFEIVPKTTDIGIGFEVGGVPVENATVGDDLNITLSFDFSVSGNVTLEVYDPTQTLVRAENKTVNNAASAWFVWDVDGTATSAGNYNVTLSLEGEFAVGYNESLFEIVPKTTDIYIGFEVGGVPVENATVDDSLNITVTFDASVTGNVTLRVYDPSQTLNHTEEKTVISATGTWFIWDVSNNATSTGNYNVTISLEGELFVGYKNTTLTIVPKNSTALIVTSFSSNVEYPNTVSITLFYKDNITGLGISGAVITAYEGSNQLTIHNFTDYGNGTYSFVLDFGTDFGVHDVYFVAGGVRFFETGNSSTISINYKPSYFVVINPEYTGLIALMFNMATEQNQNFTRYLLIGAVVGSVIAATAAADRLRRGRKVPVKALASLENIIVDHATAGITLWAFDFLKMEQDVTLVSGFMSAVKSFMGEMYKGGLRKLETEFITFIREEGELLTATCITSGNTPREEKWIRQRLRKFLLDAEQQHRDELKNWRGDVSAFRASLLEILATVINLDEAEKLQRERVSQINKKRERLQEELNRLSSQQESLKQQFEAEEITEEEFIAQKDEIEQKYTKVQEEYIDASLFLSKIPFTPEAKLITPELIKKTEQLQNKLLKIRMEIEKLQIKEQEDKITPEDTKRKEKLQKELMALIEKLDKHQEK